jgi:hypothetical protein
LGIFVSTGAYTSNPFCRNISTAVYIADLAPILRDDAK